MSRLTHGLAYLSAYVKHWHIHNWLTMSVPTYLLDGQESQGSWDKSVSKKRCCKCGAIKEVTVYNDAGGLEGGNTEIHEIIVKPLWARG